MRYTASLLFFALFSTGVSLVFDPAPGMAQAALPNPVRTVAVPSAPRSFEAIAVSPSEIRCYWLAAPGATGYVVLRDGQPTATLPAGATEYADTGLLPNTNHRYRVQAQFSDQSLRAAPDYVERTFARLPNPPAPFPNTHRFARREGGAKPETLHTDSEFGRAESDSDSASVSTVSKRTDFTGSASERPESKTDVALAPPSRMMRSEWPGKGAGGLGRFDVIVVQASSGGVAAAVEAARRGRRVALVEPTTRLGGMPVNGLSATDLRRDYHAAGFFVRFRDRVRDLYAAEGVKSTGLEYEPRIAHQAMKSLCWEQPTLTVFRRVRLTHTHAHPTNADGSRRRVDSLDVEATDVQGRPTGERARLSAPAFIDATDCGDLAAEAGAAFRLGREARSPQEPHNGVIYYDRAHDRALPGSTGQADHRLQSYAYLLTVKDYGPGADKTIPCPADYNAANYAHSPAWKESWAVASGKMPNSKLELNQHPEGGDLQEINYHYPTDDYARRATVDRRYRDRVLGYLYYIQTAQGQKQIGLPDDEYRDGGGFPSLLYVREGRRIVGEQTPTENEVAQARRLTRPESIGIGDYPMDSHAVRRKTDWTRPDMGEGEWWLYQYTPWHELPYGILVPRRLENVWVTTAVSSTHVSFGTYRLEVVRMQFGQTAAIAACLALRYHLDARDVPVRQIQDDLLPHAANPYGDPDAMLTYLSDVKSDAPYYRAVHYLTARGFQLAAEELKPDAPTTRGEMKQMLNLLARRGRQSVPDNTRQSGGKTGLTQTASGTLYAYMGRPVNPVALPPFGSAANQSALVTRREFAVALNALMRWPTNEEQHYADTAEATGTSSNGTTAQQAINALDYGGVDSRLWDGMAAFAPNRQLYFRPDAPLTHAQLFQALYIAQTWLGPTFNDAPVDGRNGHTVPAPPGS